LHNFLKGFVEGFNVHERSFSKFKIIEMRAILKMKPSIMQQKPCCLNDECTSTT